ncbi:MAG: hypothetical protein GY796_11575, partial [Chloroflexi bacterium]|nr:hypothetical protein [Chloroflexota bacterium]
MRNATIRREAIHHQFEQAIQLLLALYPAQETIIYQSAWLLIGRHLYQPPPDPAHTIAVAAAPNSPSDLISEQLGQLNCTCHEKRILIAGQSCCSHLLAYLLAICLNIPLSTYKPPAWSSLWQSHILPDLREQMTKGMFNMHLARSRAIAWRPPNELTVQVSNLRSLDWLAHRLYPITQRTASLHASYPLQLKFITSEASMSLNQTRKKQPIHMTVYQDKYHALNFEDRLEIGKVGLFVGEYPEGGRKMGKQIAHYMDVDDARWVFRALIAGRVGFQYKEYKGSDKRYKRKGVESRVLSINISAGKHSNTYVWWDFQAGPGRLTATGAITPDGDPGCEIKVRMELNTARRHASAILAFLQAWDVLRMSQHKE